MFGLTIPHKDLKFHLVVTPGDDSWCALRSGHKPAGAFDVAAVTSFLRSTRSNVFVMGELRTLVSRYGDPASRMSDAEVLEKVTRMLTSGYLRVLECGGEPAEPDVPS